MATDKPGVKNHLADVTATILGQSTSSTSHASKPRGSAAISAPVHMAQFSASYQALDAEAESLRNRLKDFEGAKATRLLDPKVIRPSVFSNRDEASFSTKDFADLKSEIADASGNVQAIKVRPIRLAGQGVGPSHPPLAADGFEYEIAFGHRRHRACLELGLPVLATVEEMDDGGLFVQMERENRNRKDLSAWEQGVMYKRALDCGLFPSNRKLAEAIGRDLSDVGKAIALASLPEVVVAAFKSPLELQFRFAPALREAWARDPDWVAKSAKGIANLSPRPGPKEVVGLLTAARPVEGMGQSHPPKSAGLKLVVDGRDVATIECSKKGAMRIDIAVGTLSPDKDLKDLAKVLEAFFAKRQR